MIVGLTGSIASGKSFVAKMFEKMGYPVFYADDEAKKLYYDNDVIRDLKSTISEDLYKGKIIDIDLEHKTNSDKGEMFALWIENGNFYSINEKGVKSNVE